MVNLALEYKIKNNPIIKEIEKDLNNTRPYHEYIQIEHFQLWDVIITKCFIKYLKREGYIK